MLLSKKHSKSPNEKPTKKVSKLNHLATTDPLKDTDDESETAVIRTSNVHRPKKVEDSARKIKISFVTKREDTNAFFKHVSLLQKLQDAPLLIDSIFNKRHETLKSSAIVDLHNKDIYKNHFDLHQVSISKKEEEVLNIVIQDFTSKFKLNEIKRQTNLVPFLKEHKIKIVEHDWRSEDWNTGIIGFTPQYAPTSFPKETVYQKMLELVKTAKEVPEFRIRPIWITQEVLGKRLSIQVYSIEVRRNDIYKANQVFNKLALTPEDYVSFRLQKVNEKAFKSAVALAAQIQQDSRTIIINNVAEEAFFILDTQLQSIADVIGYFHDVFKQAIRIIVHYEDFTQTRQYIQQSIDMWNSKLDPSDVRVTGLPEMALIPSDDYSESENSQFSASVESLLSLDLTEFTIFQAKSKDPENPTDPISDVTMESYKATIEIQNAKIEKQDAQIESLLTIIQQLNTDMNNKFDRVLQLITSKSTTDTLTTVETCVATTAESATDSVVVEKTTPSQQPVKLVKSAISTNRRK